MSFVEEKQQTCCLEGEDPTTFKCQKALEPVILESCVGFTIYSMCYLVLIFSDLMLRINKIRIIITLRSQRYRVTAVSGYLNSLEFSYGWVHWKTRIRVISIDIFLTETLVGKANIKWRTKGRFELTLSQHQEWPSVGLVLEIGQSNSHSSVFRPTTPKVYGSSLIFGCE